MDVEQPARIARRSRLERVFLGEQGFRAGWSVLAFAAIFKLVETGAITLFSGIALLKPDEPVPPMLALIRESCELAAVVAATWVMSRIEGRSLFSYGFNGRNKMTRLATGAFWGFVSLSALVGQLWHSGALVFEGKALTGLVAWKYAFVWLLVFLLVGLFEEALLRGYLQYRLSRAVGFWWAALGLSVAFALMHLGNRGESTFGLLSIGFGGMVFCLSLWYTKSLLWAVGFHAGWDWSQSYFYGTANSGLVMEGHLLKEHPAGNPLWSGGTAGPEASLLLIPQFILAALCMWFWWSRRSRSFDSTQM